MRNLVFSACTLIGILTTSELFAQDDAEKKDMKKLEGTWSLVFGQRDGKKVSDEEAKNTVITIKGNEFIFPAVSKIGTSAKGTIKLDTAKNPKWMDSFPSNDGTKFLGIYEFVDNGYKVCFSEQGKERPKEFSAKAGSGFDLQIWADNLQGAYSLTSGELKGKTLSAETINGASIIIDKNSYNVKFGETTIIGTQKLSPGKLPKEIDAMGTVGPNKGLTLGIYKFENGVFTVCFAPLGKDRPKEFTSKSGTGEFMHIWKKK